MSNFPKMTTTNRASNWDTDSGNVPAVSNLGATATATAGNLRGYLREKEN